jgi:hypothetical protein
MQCDRCGERLIEIDRDDERLTSFRAEPVHVDLPILSLPTFDGHQTRGSALSAAKRHIDHLLAE